jgi:uncharacterized membrane protein
MTTLPAITYPDETSAVAAGEETLRRGPELELRPDGVAVVVRDGRGECQVTTNHEDRELGAAWGLFWRVLCDRLLFAPPPLTDGDAPFRRRLRDLARPGTSTLLLVVTSDTTDAITEAVGRFAGIPLSTPLDGSPPLVDGPTSS